MARFVCDTDKPRVLFVLVAEHTTKYSDVIVSAVKLKLSPNVYHYNCSEHVDMHSTNLYNTWFTEIMMRKGDRNVVVVTHDENEEMMMETFDIRMHDFHSIYSHMFSGSGLNTKHVTSLDGWMIANNAATCTPCKAANDKYVNQYANPESDPTNAFDAKDYPYNIAVNSFGNTQVWNACKAIVICSNTLPIKGEFIPITENDGLLIHENSARCKKNYQEYHDGKKKRFIQSW